ncbi:hypothetical protein N431DRAFT_86663 [Stipitochalara longipes BDJ]|nr:hypothetical protein N431DRAFT_86663 [Stipitochalara longipes BDJ]
MTANPLPFLCPSLLHLVMYGLLTLFHSSAKESTSSSSAFFTSATEQEALSNSRTSSYVADPTASHVQHRHRSTKQAMTSHAANMKAYLDHFDTIMAKHEK